MFERYVATPLLKASTASEVMQKEIAKAPVGRIAEMEEIGDAIAFLVSPLSSYMCGASLVADG
jgi:NAD(P)-dependent dehydrogenase (short-subunit alcohol dehydrogenase family)